MRSALDKVAAEMVTRGVKAHVETLADKSVQLVIGHENMRDFIYGVRCSARPIPPFALHNASLPASEREYSYNFV